MARPIVVFNCARNYPPGSLEHDMPRLHGGLRGASDRGQGRPRARPELATPRCSLPDATTSVARRWSSPKACAASSRRASASRRSTCGAATELGHRRRELARQLDHHVGSHAAADAGGRQADAAVDRKGALQHRADAQHARHGAARQDVGLVGLGRIGRLVAGLTRAFGMQRAGVRPVRVVERPGGVVSLDRVLRESDFVSLPPGAHARDLSSDQRRAPGADEADGLPDQHVARRSDRRAGADRRAAAGADRWRGPGRVRDRAASAGQPAAAHGRT